MENFSEQQLQALSDHVENLKQEFIHAEEEVVLIALVPIENDVEQEKFSEVQTKFHQFKHLYPDITRYSTKVEQRYRAIEIYLIITRLEQKVKANPRSQDVMTEVLDNLPSLERQVQGYKLATLSGRLKVLRQNANTLRNDLTAAPLQRAYLNPLNRNIMLGLLTFSVLTALPIFLSDHTATHWGESWLYTLHPEMAGMLVGFIVLTLVFEHQKELQQLKQLQLAYYSRLVVAPDHVAKTQLLREMQQEGCLERSDLRGLDWEAVDFSGLILVKVNLKYGINLLKTTFDEKTRLPKGEICTSVEQLDAYSR